MADGRTLADEAGTDGASRGEQGAAGEPGDEQSTTRPPGVTTDILPCRMADEAEQAKQPRTAFLTSSVVSPGSGLGSMDATRPVVGDVASLGLGAWDLGGAALSGPGAWSMGGTVLSGLRAQNGGSGGSAEARTALRGAIEVKTGSGSSAEVRTDYGGAAEVKTGGAGPSGLDSEGLG